MKLRLLLLLLLLPAACVTTPLARSYDDPYNAPLPNEPAPPSLSPAEERCTRDSFSCDDVCVSDSDCDDDERCAQAVCTSKDASTQPPPQLTP